MFCCAKNICFRAIEIERLEHGEDSKEDKLTSFIDIHSENPQAVTVKVRIPAREYPKVRLHTLLSV